MITKDPSSSSKFPDLRGLDGSAREVITRLTSTWIGRHENFDKALVALAGFIDDGVPAQLIALVGESRTGKSVLLRAILIHQRWVAKQCGRKIGAVLIELSVGENGKFDSVDFYSKVLEQTDAILIGQKIPYPPLELGAPNKKELAAKGKSRGLEHAFRNTVMHEPFTILIDDSNTQVGTLGPNALRRFAETLKYLSNSYNVTLVIAGCPEIKTLLLQTDQLVSRREEVLLEAYGVGADDLQALCDFLGELEEQVGNWCAAGTLTDNTEVIQRLSFGRVGLIVLWTIRAIAGANRVGSLTFDWERWKKIALPAHQSLLNSAHISFGKRQETSSTYRSAGEKTPNSTNASGSEGTVKKARPFRRKPTNKALHPHG
jgi:hypothetical protein